MNVFDFDKTIHRGDSTAAFYRWTLRHYPRVLLSLPNTAIAFACLALKLRSKTRCKEQFYRFLRFVPEDAPLLFWQEHNKDNRSLFPWYLSSKSPDDIVISASPEFLLKPVAQALGFTLIASRVDPKNGKTEGLNCHGEEKVRRFRALYPEAVIENFYSDSHADDPLAREAQRAFRVTKNGTLRPW